MYRSFFSPPTWPMEFVQSLKNFAANPKKWWSDRKSVTRHWLLSTILTFVVVGSSVGITQNLVLNDVDDRVALSGFTNQQISLVANFLDVDTTARTATIEWYPLAFDCSDPEIVVNIFADQNLLVVDGSDNAPGSADPPSAPIFQLNTTESCHPNNHYSFAVFRTTAKLTGTDRLGSVLKSRSLQAYPFDLYFFQISMFASLASTNETVGIVIEKSFGIPINVDITLNPADSSNDEDGVLLSFTVKRSGAVKGLVVLIIIANWLVTIAFLWITVAVFIWDAEIVTEMFVLPIGALFAFTAVRANLPGAPSGFGAVVDYYGILPNLLLMTLLGGTLLLGVLYRRVHSRPSNPDSEKGAEEPVTLQDSETFSELQRALREVVVGMEKVTAAMDQHAAAAWTRHDGGSAAESNVLTGHEDPGSSPATSDYGYIALQPTSQVASHPSN